MSKSKLLRTALVGCGRISVYHIAALESIPEVTIVAVCDLNEELARSRAEVHRVPSFYTDVEAMLREQRPDVVHILTPPKSHLALAKLSAQYGAHMYIEKPMASSEAEAREIVKAARAAGVEICPGHSRVYDPPFLEACRRIDAGEIGRVLSVKAEQGFGYEAAAHSVVPPWSYTYDWGILENLMPHPLSMACYFLDEPGEPRVVGFNLGRVREAAVEEIRVLIPARNGIGEVSLSLCNAPEVNRLEVVGTRGRVCVDFNAMSVTCLSQSGLPGAVTRFTANMTTALQLTRATAQVVTGIVTGKVKRYAGLRNLVAAFYQALLRGVPPPLNGMDGLTNARLLDRIRRECMQVAKRRVPATAAAVVQPRILVTGASGFLGGRLVERLAAEGEPARAMTRMASRAQPMPAVEWAQGDLANEAELRAALVGIDTVYHCAAMAGAPGSLEEYEEANVNGTLRLARLAQEAGVRNLVYISTISVYGMPAASPYLDEQAPYDERAADRGMYTQTKLSAERALLEYLATHPAPRTVILRPGAIYGPGNPIPFGRLKLPSPNTRPIIAGGRRVPMPLIYVDNLIDAMRAAAESTVPSGRIYNIIDSSECTQGEVARVLRDLSHGKIRSSFIPYPLVYGMMLGVDLATFLRHRKLGTARYRFKRTVADMRYLCTAAREELKWRPSVSLRDGLARTVERALDLPTRPSAPPSTQGTSTTDGAFEGGAGMPANSGAY